MNEQFEKGLRQARSVIRREPGAVEYWLARARRSRRRPKTWLFDWKKRRFLNGFIAGLEQHRTGNAGPADPTTDDPNADPAGLPETGEP